MSRGKLTIATLPVSGSTLDDHERVGQRVRARLGRVDAGQQEVDARLAGLGRRPPGSRRTPSSGWSRSDRAGTADVRALLGDEDVRAGVIEPPHPASGRDVGHDTPPGRGRQRSPPAAAGARRPAVGRGQGVAHRDDAPQPEQADQDQDRQRRRGVDEAEEDAGRTAGRLDERHQRHGHDGQGEDDGAPTGPGIPLSETGPQEGEEGRDGRGSALPTLRVWVTQSGASRARDDRAAVRGRGERFGPRNGPRPRPEYRFYACDARTVRLVAPGAQKIDTGH